MIINCQNCRKKPALVELLSYSKPTQTIQNEDQEVNKEKEAHSVKTDQPYQNLQNPYTLICFTCFEQIKDQLTKQNQLSKDLNLTNKYEETNPLSIIHRVLTFEDLKEMNQMLQTKQKHEETNKIIGHGFLHLAHKIEIQCKVYSQEISHYSSQITQQELLLSKKRSEISSLQQQFSDLKQQDNQKEEAFEESIRLLQQQLKEAQARFKQDIQNIDTKFDPLMQELEQKIKEDKMGTQKQVLELQVNYQEEQQGNMQRLDDLKIKNKALKCKYEVIQENHKSIMKEKMEELSKREEMRIFRQDMIKKQKDENEDFAIYVGELQMEFDNLQHQNLNKKTELIGLGVTKSFLKGVK